MMKKPRMASAIVLLSAACGGEPAALVQPEVLPGPSPFRYPVAQWDQGVEGEAVLLVHVGDRGQVDSAMVHATSGVGALDTAALAGARGLRFTPGRRGDHYVGMWTRLPVRFAIDSAAAAAKAAQPDSTSPDTASRDSIHE